MNLNSQTFTESNHPAYPCMIFILAFFHAILLDRRKYDKIGWSCTYDFNESDCKFFLFQCLKKINVILFLSTSVYVSVDILKSYLNSSLEHGSLEIPWSTLRYLIGEGKFDLYSQLCELTVFF